MIGHDHILHFFETVERAGNLSHAYCLIGPEHVGKRGIVETVVARLQGTTREKLFFHPDVMLVEQEENEKTGKTKKNIDIDQVRTIRSALTQRPLYGRHRVAIIDGAEKMTPSAANALLKTLEEPGATAVIFLVTKAEKSLPPTILSRCQKIYVAPVAPHLLAAALEAEGMGAEESDEMVTLAHGLPGLLVSWRGDKEAFLEYREEWSRFFALAGKPLYERPGK